MELWTDFIFTLSLDDILRGEGADPSASSGQRPEQVRKKRPALVRAASTAGHLGFTKLQPVAVIQDARVIEHRHEQISLEDGKKLTGTLVTRHLAGAERVAAAVCTIGPELEKLAAAQEDFVLALALDGLGNAAVEAVAQQVCQRLAEQAQAAGLEAGTPLSPGEPDWPAEVGQPQIFSLADPARAGVRLTEGGMMVPKKSVSFILGIGQNMEKADACELCSMNERCRYRHA
ncbi:MAG: hypothetical protein AB1531_10225 [Chloroflexota bacterium]